MRSLLPLPLPLSLTFFAFLASKAAGYTPLSDRSLAQHLPRLFNTSSFSSSRLPSPDTDPDFDPSTGALLAPILVPRVPGTPGHAAVQQHFVSFARSALHGDWDIAWHNSTSRTPATGDRPVPFANLVLRRDPPWTTKKSKTGGGGGGGGGGSSGSGSGNVARLTLAAHYDSLRRPEGFVGAVDSAAPCAVLLAVLRAVDGALTRLWEERGGGDGDGMEEEEVGLQVLLLDGEEAWVEWSEADSLYGSRALAEAWESTRYEAGSAFATPLDAISLFVLLDLLGAPEPRVPSYFSETHWAYQNLAKIEGRLRKLGVLETRPKRNFLPEGGKEPKQFMRGFVQDDHVPFMQRGVDVLHIIPTPFPSVWHTMDDDGAHLDVPTIRDWARIMTAFVAEWMDLEGHLAGGGRGEREERSSQKDEL